MCENIHPEPGQTAWHPGTPTARTSVGARAKQPVETRCSSIKVPCPSPALDPVLTAARPDRHISQRAFSVFYYPYGLQFQLETLSTHPHLQVVGGRPSATQPTQPTSSLTGTGALQSCGSPVTANQDWCSQVSDGDSQPLCTFCWVTTRAGGLATQPSLVYQ